MPENAESPVPAAPVIEKTRWRISIIWIVPIVSALVALTLMVRHLSSEGPTIHVFFQTAEGLEAGKTEVKFKDVPIGTVSGITVSDDLTHVIVSIGLHRSAQAFARENTRFWVVRPRIGASGISGIGTLLSGAYIEADPGKSDQEQTEFTGLEVPPPITSESHGSQFTLYSRDLGSLDLGSPVYYRRLRVGEVVSYELDKNGQGVTIGIFVDTPNDRLVTPSSRFWNASGIDFSLGADGLKVNTESLASIAAGGVAFVTPSWAPNSLVPATAGTRFELLKDEKAALERPSGDPLYVWMQFDRSLRGLSINAPVEFVGVEIGRVVSVTVDYDASTERFPISVGAVVYPEKIGHLFQGEKTADPDEDARRFSELMSKMVAHGLRAQARSGSLITGQLYVAIDFVPHAKQVAFDGGKRPLQIPTAPGTLDDLQAQVSSIVTKIDSIPFESLGGRLDKGLGELDSALNRFNTKLLPESEQTLAEARKVFGAANDALSADSPLQSDVRQTLDEFNRSARSLRALTDYLSRHPESLLRGVPADPSPEVQKPAPPTDTSKPKP